MKKALILMAALLSAASLGAQQPIYGSGGGGGGGSGTVTNIATSCGTSGGPITITGTITDQILIDSQNGASPFAIPSGDCGKQVNRNQASAVSDTISQAGGSFPAGWFVYYQCRGAGGCTITPTTSTIDGGANIVLTQGQGIIIISDGTNYVVQKGSGAGGGLGDPGGNGYVVRTALNTTANRTFQAGTGISLTNADGTAGNTQISFSTAFGNSNYTNLAAAVDYVVGGGSANAQTATYGSSLTALFDGLHVCWLPTAANSGAATFAPNGLTAHALVKANAAALAANDLLTTQVACAVYQAATTNWQLLNPQTSSAGGLADPGANGIVKRTALNTTAVATDSDISSAGYVAGGGTAQAQTATLSPAIAALTNGLTVCWLPAAANSGAGPTLAVNGLTATNITKFGTTALVANDITTSAIACAKYDGTQFQLQNPQTANGGSVTGSQGIAVSSGNASLIDLTKYYIREDFMHVAASNAIGDAGNYGLANAVASSCSNSNAPSNIGFDGTGSTYEVGVWQFGTLATGSGLDCVFQMSSTNPPFNFPNAGTTTLTFEAKVRLLNVTGSQTYSVGLSSGIGFGGSVLTSCTGGNYHTMYFSVVNTGSAGTWNAITCDGNAATSAATSPAQTADTNWHILKWVFTNSGTPTITFYFCDPTSGSCTQVGSSTTHLPNTAIAFAMEIQTGAATAGNIMIDSWRFYTN